MCNRQLFVALTYHSEPLSCATMKDNEEAPDGGGSEGEEGG